MKHLRLIGFAACLALPANAHADIYRWDTGEVIPGTEGITPGPGVQLLNLDLAFAELEDAPLPNANLSGANLTHASLLRATLTNANLEGANFESDQLVGAYLTNADLRGSNSPLNYSLFSRRERVADSIRASVA
jgi:uncharacterized protein YjbI with pentapeptide repeats